MKKLIALFLAVVFVSASVVGCGSDTKDTKKPAGTTTPTDKKTTP